MVGMVLSPGAFVGSAGTSIHEPSADDNLPTRPARPVRHARGTIHERSSAFREARVWTAFCDAGGPPFSYQQLQAHSAERGGATPPARFRRGGPEARQERCHRATARPTSRRTPRAPVRASSGRGGRRSPCPRSEVVGRAGRDFHVVAGPTFRHHAVHAELIAPGDDVERLLVTGVPVGRGARARGAARLRQEERRALRRLARKVTTLPNRW
jgi:hypothetical protein